MSKILIFPGQGAQVVGMGKDLYDNSPAARKVFETVDDALSQKLSDIIFNGPMDELTLTSNVQPAIFATSMAMAEAARERGILPDAEFVAGHSLGEYTALCFAGCMSIADTAKILRIRGDAMQSAVPVGIGMVSVIMGLPIEKVHEICTVAGCEVANDNMDGQVVISGSVATASRAMELAREAGAKRAMQLPLSAPVHCSMQAPTADIMRDALSEISFKKPAFSFISNKTAGVMNDPDEIKDALVYQITNGVRWRESVLNMSALGITDAIEIGPGNILTGLVGRIAPEITATKLEV